MQKKKQKKQLLFNFRILHFVSQENPLKKKTRRVCAQTSRNACTCIFFSFQTHHLEQQMLTLSNLIEKKALTLIPS